MLYQFENRWFEPESRYLTLRLPDSSEILDNLGALRSRMEKDGFLFIRGFHQPEEILQCRREILLTLRDSGQLDRSTPLMAGIPARNCSLRATTSVRGNEDLRTAALRRVVYGRRTMRFFDRFFGGSSLSFNFQWLRAALPGAGSPIHYDIIYMGRGTSRLYTLWTPLGRITPEMGPLVLCLGSHRWHRVIDTYGCSDVDRDLIEGTFSRDPAELVDRFGGRWATTVFEPGDVVVMGMFLMHASLTNNSGQIRLSCDTRYQLASEPVDDRWSGRNPKGHTEFWRPGVQLEPLDVSRQKWGV